jgi:hypothetical protein
MKSPILWDITPFSPLKVNRRIGGTYRSCLPPGFTLISCLAYSSALKMEATCSSETSVDFQRAKRCYIPEDRTLRIKTSLTKWHQKTLYFHQTFILHWECRKTATAQLPIRVLAWISQSSNEVRNGWTSMSILPLHFHDMGLRHRDYFTLLYYRIFAFRMQRSTEVSLGPHWFMQQKQAQIPPGRSKWRKQMKWEQGEKQENEIWPYQKPRY